VPEFITKDSGERVDYASGMRRDVDTGKPRFDLTEPEGIPYEERLSTRFAALLGRGADKYGTRNWENANSEEEIARFKGSAHRHFMQWLSGETDEDHAAATLFNILAAETTRYKVDQAAALEQEFAALADDDDDDLFMPGGILHGSWQNVGYVDEGAVPVAFKTDEPTTVEFELTDVSPATMRLIWGDPVLPTLTSRAEALEELKGWYYGATRPSMFDDFDEAASLQPYVNAMCENARQLADLALIEEHHLHDVSFFVSAEGDVTDVRQAINAALNRRD